MGLFSLLLITVIPALCHCYSLLKELNGSNFFDGSYWDFFTSNDPTHGYVNYVDKGTASSKGYINGSVNEPVYIGCDHTNVASGRGRDSVRLRSKQSYNSGLFILYLAHMPTGCGTWPAWWTVGPNWPNSGEIDIIEQVDTMTNDTSALHANKGCDFGAAPRNYTGTGGATDCSTAYTGCGITCGNVNSFGAAFNSKGGGLYVMEWTSQRVATWMWNEGDIPSNAKSNSPDPSHWGIPYGQWVFGAWCPRSNFANHQVIFDLTFCGDWDGYVFSQDCPGDGQCNDYVKNNPSAFTEAFWSIHFMKVFQ